MPRHIKRTPLAGQQEEADAKVTSGRSPLRVQKRYWGVRVLLRGSFRALHLFGGTGLQLPEAGIGEESMRGSNHLFYLRQGRFIDLRYGRIRAITDFCIDFDRRIDVTVNFSKV